MRRNIYKQLTLIWILAVLCLSHVATAATSKGVSWAGESILDVTYKQVDGRAIKMDIYMPLDKKTKAAPVLYYVHGGGWAAGDKSKGGLPLMLPVFQQVAERGFACVSINYRLCKKDSGVVMRDCVTDAIDGLRFLKKHAEHFGLDPNRIVVWGDSAGGHLAQMLALADPDRFLGEKTLAGFKVKPIAGISWYGPTDFTDVNLFKTDISPRNPDRFGSRIAGATGGYEQHKQAYEDVSPYFWIKKESPPLLLIQGDTDATIPLAHAHHLHSKAGQIGAPVTKIIVEHSGHNWRNAGGNANPSKAEIQLLTANYAIRQIEDTGNKN